VDVEQLSEAPPRGELLRRVAEVAPVLRRHAIWNEEHRLLHEEVVSALTEAELLKTRVPAQHGGFESNTRTQVEVLSELARADGSASWVTGVWSISTWAAGLFPDAAQEEVFATPDVRISGIISPTAMAAPAPGGIVVNGQWAFNTGAQQSQWGTMATVLVGPEGPQPVMTLIPLSDLETLDDWHTTGLRGSGSVTSVAHDVFVPPHRVLPLGALMSGRGGAGSNADHLLHRVPIMPMACVTVGATALGIAKAARDAFFERLPGRKITYTDYDDQSRAPLTHLQVGDAEIRIDEAEFHVLRLADLIDRKNAADEPWTLAERLRARLDIGAATQRAKEAVEVLSAASGASSVHLDVPIQRIERDMRTLSLHAVMQPTTNTELYGRYLCGLEPNTQYL
jgi:alkylation response protein AidB-like acyl-CoA dehydrogenase